MTYRFLVITLQGIQSILANAVMSDGAKRSMVDRKKLVIATRLHLGNALSPPTPKNLKNLLRKFEALASSVDNAFPVVAVDATPRMEGYDYVQAVRDNLQESSNVHVLPVTPWGKFVPALNAVILHSNVIDADLVLFVSAEVSVSPESIHALCLSVVEDQQTLVAGAAMNGHLYSADTEVELNGRTCPWNTLAVWDVRKLALTGFSLCSDIGDSAGVEECAAIALYQKLFPDTKAKLVQLADISWEESFDDDERRSWHERKMNSKVERAMQQLQALNLAGKVLHC